MSVQNVPDLPTDEITFLAQRGDISARRDPVRPISVLVVLELPKAVGCSDEFARGQYFVS